MNPRLAFGCLSPHHAGQFKAYIKQVRGKYKLAAIMKGEMHWPDKPQDRDLLYFLSQSLRAKLIKELPGQRDALNADQKELAHRAKALMKDLAALSLEMAQMVVSEAEDAEKVPEWFLVDLAPRPRRVWFRRMAKGKRGQLDPALESYLQGYKLASSHPLFRHLLDNCHIVRESPDNHCPQDGWAVVLNTSYIHVHPTRRASPQESGLCPGPFCASFGI